MVKAGDGEMYRLVVLKVTGTRDDILGASGEPMPATFELMLDDDVAVVAEGMHFVTAYVPVSVFGMPNPRG